MFAVMNQLRYTFQPSLMSPTSTFAFTIVYQNTQPEFSQILAAIFVALVMIIAMGLIIEFIMNLVKAIFLPKYPTIKQVNIQAAIQGLVARVPEPEQLATNPAFLTRLSGTLDRKFNGSDLRIMCYALGINYDDDLSGNTKKEKILSLLDDLVRKGAIPDLIKEAKNLRPDYDWDLAMKSPIEDASTAEIGFYLDSLQFLLESVEQLRFNIQSPLRRFWRHIRERKNLGRPVRFVDRIVLDIQGESSDFRINQPKPIPTLTLKNASWVMLETEFKQEKQEARRVAWIRITSLIIGIMLAYTLNLDMFLILGQGFPIITTYNILVVPLEKLPFISIRSITAGILVTGLWSAIVASSFHNLKQRGKSNHDN